MLLGHSLLQRRITRKAPTEHDSMQNGTANNVQKSSLSVPNPTPGHSRHSVPSTEGVFCHLATSAEKNSPYHSVPSMEERSQMNCASISDMAESPETPNSSNSGSTKPSLSVVDLPLTQEKMDCRSKGVHHCRYGQRPLASSTTSRFQKIYLHGI